MTGCVYSDPAVNSAQFVSLRVDKVRVDEMFMHKYFVQKSSLEQKATKETVAMSEADLPANDEDELDFARCVVLQFLYKWSMVLP